MNIKSGALCAMKRMDDILLKPCLSLRLGVQDQKKGISAQEHSFTVSFGTTLLRMMALLAAFLVIGKVMCKIRNKRMERKWKAKYKKRMRQGGKKMSKS